MQEESDNAKVLHNLHVEAVKEQIKASKAKVAYYEERLRQTQGTFRISAPQFPAAAPRISPSLPVPFFSNQPGNVESVITGFYGNESNRVPPVNSLTYMNI
uniref:Uncharacterized protein n=1 Tax=Romanomermis culicivorax TaxID=13658 RepID=A0A915IXR6_ROMCU